MNTELKPMRRSTPEREGIPSGAIEKYMRALADANIAMHSVMVVRHRRIVFESYWKPFDENFRHRLYSCSKSIVSMAIGYLADKGLIDLDDRCVKYFDGKIAGRTIDPLLEETTIRDLLRMASPWTKGANYSAADPDWEETFFTDEVSHVPGTVFSYCTSGTTVLCYIIKYVTGVDFLEVLRPVFDEIGVSRDIFCVKSPDGIEWGGSGVCATAREFAKIADLCMHYGEYEGKQLLPRDYLMTATTSQIDNSIYADCDDRAQGYGYQFWMTKNDGFAFFGMGGQYALCFPKQDLMIVTTGYEELSQTGRMEIFSALWREIFPLLSDNALPENQEAQASLKAYADGLEFIHVQGDSTSPVAESVSGRTFIMRGNAMGLKRVRFDFDGGEGTMTYENATGSHVLRFGLCRNVRQEFPELYSGRRLGVKADRGYDCQVSAAWTRPDTLILHCYVTDIHLGQLRMAIAFKGDTVTINAVKHAEWFLDEYEGFASGRII